MFCPARRFVPPDVLSTDVLSPDDLSPDVLSLNVLSGHHCICEKESCLWEESRIGKKESCICEKESCIYI